MNHKRIIFSALALLASMIACAVPGAPSASSPAPVADTGRLETMVAETVSAAIQMTEQAPTPTPIPTSTPTVAPTREAGDPGSTLVSREDGVTLLFTDERAGYQIVIPENWLAVRINQPEYYDAWSLGTASDPNIQSALLSIQDKDPNILRLLAIDVKDGHLQGGVVTNLTFIWDGATTLALDSEDELQAIADSLTEATPGLDVISQSIIISPTQMQFGAIEAETTVLNGAGQETALYQKVVFFNAKTGMQAITLTTSNELKDEMITVFDAMLDTIQVDAE